MSTPDESTPPADDVAADDVAADNVAADDVATDEVAADERAAARTTPFTSSEDLTPPSEQRDQRPPAANQAKPEPMPAGPGHPTFEGGPTLDELSVGSAPSQAPSIPGLPPFSHEED